LALLAQALDKAHQTEERLSLLGEGLAVAHRKGERNYEAELYRLKGELLLTQARVRGLSRGATGGQAVEAELPHVTQAEACFHQSIKIAKQQKAKSWELRASMSMARLYKNQNKQKEAQALLAQIYERFTEGFDTLDLREAEALLDELS
jgi:predicted ATPase